MKSMDFGSYLRRIVMGRMLTLMEERLSYMLAIKDGTSNLKEPTGQRPVCITQAFVDAGFLYVSHIGLSNISPELVSANLLKYLSQPHVTLIECKK